MPRKDNALLFPVIAWYDIIKILCPGLRERLLFPVIAWYDIILQVLRLSLPMLLFPVIAWYDIICMELRGTKNRCCSQLSLGMI